MVSWRKYAWKCERPRNCDERCQEIAIRQGEERARTQEGKLREEQGCGDRVDDENRSAIGGNEGVDPPQWQGRERACRDDKANEQHQHNAKREPSLNCAGRQIGEHKLMRF